MIGTPEVVVAIQVFTTLFMVGLIWFVQVVHYPLFAAVDAQAFAEYERRHQSRTTWIVAPIMSLELLTSILLVLDPPSDIASSWLWSGLILLIGIWMSTCVLQVPAHRALARGYSREQIRRLVSTNWIRTVAWSCRAVVVLVIAGQSVT